MSTKIIQLAAVTGTNQDEFIKSMEQAFKRGSEKMKEKGFIDYTESIQYHPVSTFNEVVYTAMLTWTVTKGESK